jgi:hypothetical protein
MREAAVISYIMTILRGHQPQIFECIHTGNYYLLLPENMLQKSKVAARFFGKKGVKVKLVVKHNKKYTKICCVKLLQLEGVVKEICDKK